MDHVSAGHVHHDDLVHRNHNLSIGCQQEFIFVVARFFQLCFHCIAQHIGLCACIVIFRRHRGGLTNHVAVKGKFMIGVFIAPVPLVAGDFDMHFAFGDFLLLEQNRQRKRPDEDQNHNRDNRPCDFQRRIVGKAGRGRVGAAVVADDHNRNQRNNEQRNCRDDDQDQVIQTLQVAGQFSCCGLETHKAGMGFSHSFHCVLSKGRGRGKGCCCRQKAGIQFHMSP